MDDYNRWATGARCVLGQSRQVARLGCVPDVSLAQPQLPSDYAKPLVIPKVILHHDLSLLLVHCSVLHIISSAL